MTSAIKLVLEDKETYQLVGELDAKSVPEFWQTRATWLPQQPQITLDLAKVTRVDSAGMALLLHMQQQLAQQKQSMTLKNVPQQLDMLLELHNVREIFHY